ncbi:MAG: hypothetical protein ACOZIN_13130 [Myxococcota bacterium]
MANVGELVRMENGRWARYQRCAVYAAGRPDMTDLSIVVAVELDEAQQERLNVAEASLEWGAPVFAPFERGGDATL